MRQRMVTRTIKTTKAVCLCVNIETAETFEKEVVLPYIYKDNKSLTIAAEKALNDHTIKVAHVKDSTVEDTYYGMAESEFIKVAQVLPKRAVKEAE